MAMLRVRIVAVAMVLLLLAACGVPHDPVAPGRNQAQSNSEVVADTGLGGGGAVTVDIVPTNNSGFSSQAIVHRWTGADVTSYEVTLSAGGQILAVADVHPKSGELRAKFTHLMLNVAYAVSVEARGNLTGDPTKASQVLNSRNPSVSTFTFSGTQNINDSLNVTVQVTFDSVTFDGTGTVIIGSADGSYALPASTESATGSVEEVGVRTLAGSTRGYLDAVAAIARFDTPYGITCDASGNVYVADSGNLLVRVIDPSGMVATLGPYSSTMQHSAPAATPVGFSDGIVFDGLGGILLAGGKSSVVSRINLGTSALIAGDGQVGYVNGPSASASFNFPSGIVQLPGLGIAVADTLNNVIRIISPTGYVYTWLGDGKAGAFDGYASGAEFNHPTGLAYDGIGNLYICDTGNNIIRKATLDGTVTTYAGTGQFGDEDGPALQARFDEPTGIAADANGTVYIADTNNNCIRQISPEGQVLTFAGSGYQGWVDGSLSQSRFNGPTGLALDGIGHLFVADTFNHKIRKIKIR